MQANIKIFFERKEIIENIVVPFTNAQVTLGDPQRGVCFTLYPHGCDKNEKFKPLVVDLGNIESSKAGWRTSRIVFSQFETLILVQSLPSFSSNIAIGLNDIKNLHIMNYTDEIQSCEDVEKIFFHESLTGDIGRGLSLNSAFYFINPRTFNNNKFQLSGIIGKGQDIKSFHKEALADFVWLDVYNFPEPKDWRVNIQANKFLHISRTLNDFYAPFWKNSALSTKTSVRTLVRVFDRERNKIQPILSHLEDHNFISNIKYDPADFLRSVEISLIKANLYRDAMIVNETRQRYELSKLRIFQKLNPKHIMQYLSWLLSNFQNSVAKPLVVLAVAFLLFHASMSAIYCKNLLDEETFRNTLKIIFKPWDSDTSVKMLLGSLMFVFIGSQFFMVKHAYNRHCNYKW